jgi:hypothetical protein
MPIKSIRRNWLLSVIILVALTCVGWLFAEVTFALPSNEAALSAQIVQMQKLSTEPAKVPINQSFKLWLGESKLPESSNANQFGNSLLNVCSIFQLSISDIGISSPDTGAQPKFVRTVVSAQVKGDFIKVNKMLSQLQEQFSNVVIETLSIKNEGSQGMVDAQIQWTLYHRQNLIK